MRYTLPRRSLVLTSESARHPFRAGLPPHVLAVDPMPRTWRMSRRDWRDVLGTYVSSFLAVSIFIA